MTLLAGSRDDLDGHGDARRFYGDVDLRPVDFGPAIASGHPLAYTGPAGTAPIHPSFEDRPGAIDQVFAALDDEAYERQVAAWSRELAAAGAVDADVLHLHHLTPLNEAAARVAPGVPIVGQLHGTELLMLEAIDSGVPNWPHATVWAQRLRRWAQECALIVVAEGAVDRARDVLRVDREQFLSLPSGVDPDVFRRRPIDRRAMWREVLVEHPRGWGPGGRAGSIAYQEDDLEPLVDGVVVVYIGRFTAIKRLPLLIEAFAAANEQTSTPSGLVLIGGHPGEWEGEHPAETIARIGARDVFLAGWHDHARLAEMLCAADVVALASAREQFGLALVEGMACERPAVATRSPGPVSIITDGTTGWLTDADSKDTLATALAEAIENHTERARRGRAAREVVCEQYTWDAIAERLAAILEEVFAASLAS